MEIKSQIDTTLDELGWAELEGEKREEIKQKILASFDRVILETVLMAIDDKQAEQLKALIDNESEEDLETAITGFTSEIPGLSALVDLAVRSEWERWKEILDRRPKVENKEAV